ncbi:hypothetical protein NDU88_003210 [Pleurodeles waltl]|uniref:Uncharacterized protein n=1 Tax=Pleurodeles waltl TaxID=8319 RepID=A0AAV7NFY8_PLEWA|nr:hypothetical protein NDU88_003210 [Pleurodeles waltl]
MFDEYMKGLEKKLCKLEEEITGKKQRKYIRDFKDYQAGRILTFQRKYDHMYESSTDVEVRNTERVRVIKMKKIQVQTLCIRRRSNGSL